MIELKIDPSAFLRMEKSLLALADKHIPTAMAKTLTRLATGARTEVMTRMETLFDRPTPFTMNSVRYMAATRDNLTSMVYISDDAAKGLSPRKYLKPEIEGGPRNLKRSEKALIAKGLMQPGQHIIPAEGFDLDAYGNVPGRIMVKILSRLSALGETGYRANVSDKRLKQLKRARMAARRGGNDIDGVRQFGGTDYFVAHSKVDGAPLGIYQLVSKGKVVPAFYFARRNPTYAARFPFEEMVNTYARRNFEKEMMRALMEEIAKGAH